MDDLSDNTGALRAYLCFRSLIAYDDVFFNRNVTSVLTSSLEAYNSVLERVKRVVAAHSHVLTGIELCTSLTYDDVTCLASLAAKYLNA